MEAVKDYTRDVIQYAANAYHPLAGSLIRRGYEYYDNLPTTKRRY